MITKKFVVIFLTVLMLLSLAGISASAANRTQDGLEVSFTTDKETYSKDETITATLTVKNTNESDITDVVLETVIPNGYEVDNVSSNTKQIEKLAVNETSELRVVYTSKLTGTISEDNKIGKNNENSAVIISIAVCCFLVLIIFVIKKKKIKGFLSIVISISVLSSVVAFLPLKADAVNEKQNSIEISQVIKVDKKDISLKGTVFYFQTNEADEYYNENAKVISVTKAKESDDVLSEQEVANLLFERGFNTETVVADYTMNGEYLDEAKIDEDSNEKHPIYKMLYGSKSEILWNIYVINGVVSAYPVSYNLVSNRQAVLLITETDTVTSYDYTSNQFYETIPKESVMIVRKVSKIDKETLDNLTVGGLSEL